MLNIVVIGDRIIDRYVEGEIERLSPEGPAPVVRVTREWSCPGGAANVAAAVRQLAPLAEFYSARSAAEKTRIRGRRQGRWLECARVDRPADPCPPPTVPEGFRYDMAILADYGGGSCRPESIAAARRQSTLTVADPHPSSPLGWFAGCTVVKFNREEAAARLGYPLRDRVEAALGARALRQLLGETEYVVVTLGADGAVWDGLGESGWAPPRRVSRVVDVTGAGDAFTAALAVWLARHPLREAVTKGCAAGAACVQRDGCGPPTLRDIRLAEADCPVGSRLVLTNGCFDCFHLGHLETLRFAARQKGEDGVLLVAVNDDASVRALKGEGRPLRPLDERLGAVRAVAGVDAAVAFDGDVGSLLALYRPDVLVKGGTTPAVVGAEQVEQWGGRVLRGPEVPGVSTSAIAQAIQS